MARIFRHPEVEDYFHVLDANQGSAALARTATELYEAGQVISLKGLSVDFDRQLLASLEFNEQATKKFKSISFLKHFSQGSLNAGAGPFEDMLRDTFHGDRKKVNAFGAEVRRVNGQIEGIVARLFPGYRIEKPSVTWRLNETVNENLHVDVYNEDIPGHHLRVFTNLDVVPRIWHTSHTLEHLLKNHLGALDKEFVRTATPGRICHALNFAVFKGWPEAGREGQPKHIVFFDPGEVWIVDSRKVSHQIFFGRKALSTEHVIEAGSMHDPESHYYQLVERYRNQKDHPWSS
jgi:hypothetical protein